MIFTSLHFISLHFSMIFRKLYFSLIHLNNQFPYPLFKAFSLQGRVSDTYRGEILTGGMNVRLMWVMCVVR